MEKLYRIYTWPEDPSTNEGLSRFNESLNVFKNVVSHEWFNDLVKGTSRISIVDVCGGTGIGGIALSKVLTEDLGLEVKLTIIDLRRDALEKAKRFAKQVLGEEVRILVCDVRKGMGLSREFDIALLWGLTTPHFSPWDFIRVLANISLILKDKSLLVYDETDRVHSIFYLLGYKDVIAERIENGKVVLTIHKGRDFRTGFMVRVALDLITKESVEMKVYFWDLASSAALAWIFFNDVDFIPLNRPYRGVVIARNPRRDLNVNTYLRNYPKILYGK
ncbi:MAG: hypothetical protein DRO18_02335 [Thermoprotei archaeon]|nr:MAG: hypothetical protein DRO18_02335 [Thermoprotei archaeon]